MVYLKSAIAGILAVATTALLIYVILTLLVIILIAHNSANEGFDLPHWQVHTESPAFWIVVVIVFAAGFLWEFRRIRSG
jgi:uncharacterized integral membrane protein